MVKPKTQPQRLGEAKKSAARKGRDGLTDELREELRALIAWRAPALRELEKH